MVLPQDLTLKAWALEARGSGRAVKCSSDAGVCSCFQSLSSAAGVTQGLTPGEIALRACAWSEEEP